ncbi:MAG: HsdM family class I SAM-dependent methyltransferase [Terriglobia bacterium]
MPETIEPRVVEFGRQASPGSWFLSKESEIEERRELLPYSYYLRQAWTELKLNGILCVDGRPAVYLCEAASFTQDLKRERHRFVWNQGLVPLLVFLTPNRVEVHSTVKMPERQPTGDGLFDAGASSLIPDLGNIAKALEIARFVRSIETGQFFQDHADFFPPDEAVDRCLLKNLVHTVRRLKGARWDLPRAHALLGRTLFVCFLHARKFIKPDFYPDGTTSLREILSLPRVEDAKRLLYGEFFPRLRQEFNGTMFDTALADEERHINKVHLEILADFLGRHDMESGQMSLGFWAYDFRYIPVEIISAIYEEFMKDADVEKKRSEGAYYTPRHLAETTLHVALEGRNSGILHWRVLDPACGSGIFLVAMFNLLAEQWRRENGNRSKQTKAQALLDILRKQIRGVDNNLDACRITAFSLYLALFEKLKPIDVEEFKEKVSQDPFLPPLLWTAQEPTSNAVVLHGDFLRDKLPLESDFDLIIGNPPWESRGQEQIALRFATESPNYLRGGGVGCLLLPSTILVNRYGTLDGDWFRKVAVEKIIQLADFRFVLFEATHPCFIIRYVKATPSMEHTVSYETPKLNRFDRRSGVFVIEPDDQKLVPQHDILEAALQERLQTLWSQKFWGTPRDEAFLRRLDFYPRLSDSAKEQKWHGGVGFQPFYPGVSPGKPKPLYPWKPSDSYLPNLDDFPQLVLTENEFMMLKKGLEASIYRKEKIPALLDGLRRKPAESTFKPPMVVYSKGFTKFAFCRHRVLFQDSLRSITGPDSDADLLRFVTAVLGSRLMQYLAFHSGSSNGIGRDQLYLYESLSLPFPLPDDELAPVNANEIIREVASVFKQVEHAGKNSDTSRRTALIKEAKAKLEPLVEDYYRITDVERILIEDTLTLFQPSIHRSNLDSDVPSLAFPESADRKRYADTLCHALNRRARKGNIRVRAEAMVSKKLNLIFFTAIFGDERAHYTETGGDEELWNALDRVAKAAQRENGSFNYLRGFSYFEPDRLHILKPATMRNWCRTAALNDADAIFEYLVRKKG